MPTEPYFFTYISDANEAAFRFAMKRGGHDASVEAFNNGWRVTCYGDLKAWLMTRGEVNQLLRGSHGLEK